MDDVTVLIELILKKFKKCLFSFIIPNSEKQNFRRPKTIIAVLNVCVQ